MSAVSVPMMHPEIQERVRYFVNTLQWSPQARHVLAVIVAGSACRGEEIWRDGKLISDIDLMLVTRHTNPYLTRSLTGLIRQFREYRLDGGTTPLPSLRNFRTFAFYEASATGVVMWGDYDINVLIPPINAKDVPRWEAIRVLANRMFEHLKLECGQTTAQEAAAKSYEALAEASLGLVGRYRPTHRGRLGELLDNPPSLLSREICQVATEVLCARLNEYPNRLMPGATDARRDLLKVLHIALGSYLQTDGTISELLSLLGRKEHHWRHRAYWAMVQGQASNFFRIDPSIALWREAARALQTSADVSQAEKLVSAWRACPSIQRRDDPAYINRKRINVESQSSFPG